MIRCWMCKTQKHCSKFPRNKSKLIGRNRECKDCRNSRRRKLTLEDKSFQRSNNLRALYKMTIEDYNQLLVQQKGLCAICGTASPGKGKDNFSIDHCHSTNKIRGLLCSGCNVGLGYFSDNPEICEKAASYLREKKYINSIIGGL